MAQTKKSGAAFTSVPASLAAASGPTKTRQSTEAHAFVKLYTVADSAAKAPGETAGTSEVHA